MFYYDPDFPINDISQNDPAALGVSETAVPVPYYLSDVYTWAYLDPSNVDLLDRQLVVDVLLFGNGRRLGRALCAEIEPGQRVLQATHAYGTLIPELAARVGGDGFLDVIDVAPVQIEHCRRKIAGMPQARARLADATQPGPDRYDVVSCFFLLHELPDDCKRTAVDALLDQVAPGGKAVFVDYHNPRPWHPLRGVLSLVFKWLEPFAPEMWTHEIADFAARRDDFQWRTQCYFGGLYQVTTAVRTV